MIEWLLDLDVLRFGQEGVEFGFARPLPAWSWVLLVLAALALAAMSYRRLEGRGVWRGVLAFLRGALLIALAVLIAGPRLIKPNETEEKDWVLVLVDRSASLKIADVDPPGGGDRITREQQLRRILEQNSRVWADLSRDRVVQWLGFDASTYELDVSEAPGGLGPVIDPGEADGRRTAIGHALSEALRRAAARPVSAVVILSDGQSADETDRATLRALTNGQIPVYSIPLGGEGAATDYAVRIADAPRVAFTNDMVPVEIRVDRLGDAGASTGRVTAQLVDSQTGLVLAEKPVVFEDGEESASSTLITQPKDAADAEWSVRLVTEPADLVSENNAAELEVELVDRPMRVVYFDGYSRWEYRYLKNLFVREDSIDSSVLLLAPNRKYLQEGDTPLDILPTSPEEWTEFDVIILGDLRPEMFTDEQLEQIREHVALRGAGLVWIGGEGSTPGAWAGTPLADLLPFTMGEGGDRGQARWNVPVTMRTTESADRLGVLRLAEVPDENGSWWPPRLSDPATGWSQLRFAQRIEQSGLKPTTEVLATAAPAAGDGAGAPLVMSMRYGAGRVLYVGTDEIWRWRYGRGEYYPERFWLQMVRLLGRERLARAGKSAILTVTPMRGEVARPMRIGVELIDQMLLDAAPPSLRARIQRTGDPGARGAADDAGEVTELILQPERSDAGFGRGSEVRQFAATWLPNVAGRYQIEVADPLLAGGSLRAEADVWRPDDEMRRPQTDHAMLAALGQATGGRIIEPGDLLRPDVIPNRKVRIIGAPEVEDLWDTPLALILVVTLLTAEWVGRRLLRLA